MRVAQIYNQQRSVGGGEERVVMQTAAWLRESGIETDLLLRSSRGIESSVLKKIKAAGSGIYNPEAYRFIRAYLRDYCPSVVHAHNLYPQWSPAVLVACREAGTPVLFTVHCQVLTCPTWYHLHKGRVCEKCASSGEHWCVLQNCRDNYVESVVYALRHFIVRKRRWFESNVTRFIAPSHFMRNKLIGAGIPAEHICVIQNGVPISGVSAEPLRGEYVTFAGRLSAEKGVGVLVEAAKKLPGVPFRIAGAGPLEVELRRRSPANVTFVGFLEKDELAHFYRGARLHVVPSVSYDVFPVSAAEGMAHGLPVVASRIGGLPEIVRENTTGLLIKPGDADALAVKVEELWGDPHRCQEMGMASRRWVTAHLGKDVYISKLVAAYREAQNAAMSIARPYGTVS